MYPEIEIAGRKIGYVYDPLVIAELGINHGGSIEVAIEMVDAAANAGAEIIKHQTHVIEDEMIGVAKNIIPDHMDESIYQLMANCALSEKQEITLQNYVKSRGLIFISTPFSRAAADRLIRMGVPGFKIGSGECNNYPLIRHIAQTGKPIIMSTGMNTIESIGKAVAIFREYKVPYALLHCTNVYPTPPHLVRLGAINELSATFPDAVVGLSDHTTSNYPALGAIALGASILERHFTDRMDRTGPDISCSMDGKALSELLEGSKILKKARGGSKGPVAEENSAIKFAYASVVTIKNIKDGEIFSRENIWVKRPGTGELLAEAFESILGQRAAHDIALDTQLKLNDIIGK